MSFEDYEESVESGQPVELYVFTVGTTTYRYTSAEDTINYGGNLYVSRQIARNSPELSVEEGRARLEITMPTDDPVCSRYIGTVSPLSMSVTLTQFHRSDFLDGRILWSGRVIQASYGRNGAVCTLTAVASESALSRPIPPYTYQSLCNHRLYDSLCTVAAASYKYTGTASGVTGRYVTVSGIHAAHGDNWAVGGKIVLGNDERLIVGQTVDELELQSVMQSSPAGQTVDVYAGCDHTHETCLSKFSNLLNFGGFPHVPGRNPIASGL